MPQVGGQDEGRVETDGFLRHGRGQARRIEDDEAVRLVRSIEGQHDPEGSSERAADEDRLLKSHGIEERLHGPSIRRDAAVVPGKRGAAVVTGKVRGDPGTPLAELADEGEPDLGPRRVAVEEEDRRLPPRRCAGFRIRQVAELDSTRADQPFIGSRREGTDGARFGQNGRRARDGDHGTANPDERKRVFGPADGQAPRLPLADYSRDTNSPIFRAVTTLRRMPSPLRTIVAPGATSRTSDASRPTTTLASPNTGDKTI